MSKLTVRRPPARTTDLARHRWLALSVVLAGTFMVVLDFFIVNVAIPSIQRELRAGTAAIEWVVAGYGLAYAAPLIIGGRLGDLYGHAAACSRLASRCSRSPPRPAALRQPPLR